MTAALDESISPKAAAEAVPGTEVARGVPLAKLLDLDDQALDQVQIQEKHWVRLENGAPLRFRLPPKSSDEQLVEVKHRLESAFKPALDIGLLTGVRTTLVDGKSDSAGAKGGSTAQLVLDVPPGNHVGFAACKLDDQPLLLEVRPKIPDADLLGLMERSGRLKGLHATGGLLARRPSRSIAHLIIWSYAYSLELLLTGKVTWLKVPSSDEGGESGDADGLPEEHRNLATGLRRHHERRSETLRGRMRGRLLLPQFLRNVVRGRPDRVPCRFQAHRLDNRPNRILRWALHRCVRLARRLPTGILPSDEQQSFEDAVRRLQELDYFFAGVPLIQERSASQDLLEGLPQVFAHYEQTGALPLALLINAYAHLGPEGADVRGAVLSIPMYSLFEHAFAKEIQKDFSEEFEVQTQVTWNVQQFRGEQPLGGTLHFRPDVVLWPKAGSQSHRAIIIDSKWKELSPVEGASDSGNDAEQQDSGELVLGNVSDGWRIRTSDVAQVLNYAYLASNLVGVKKNMATSSGAVAILVYPVTSLDPADWRPSQLQMTAGGRDTRDPLKVFAMPWCVAEGKLKEGSLALLTELRTVIENHATVGER